MATLLVQRKPPSTAFSQVVANSATTHFASTAGTLRESVSAMFFTHERSVRSIHDFYQLDGVTERAVEDILREKYREALSRTRVNAHTWRVA